MRPLKREELLRMTDHELQVYNILLLQDVRTQMTSLVTAAGDLISTSRFARGNFIGPLMDQRPYVIGREAVSIWDGGKFPVALTMECTGTGKATDFLYVGHDPRGLRNAVKIPLDKPLSIAAGNALQVLADRGQRIYAAADIRLPEQLNVAGVVVTEEGTLGGEVQLRVYYGRN